MTAAGAAKPICDDVNMPKDSCSRHILHFNSPIGTLRIEDNGAAITRLCIDNGSNYSDNESVLTKEAAKQLSEYFRGERLEFNLPLFPCGTEFQLRVWAELVKIPYGEVCTYGDIARRIGNPKASRAVGGANNKNPIMIIIPCHRVIGASGKLIGYAGGVDVKKYLLDLEGNH